MNAPAPLAAALRLLAARDRSETELNDRLYRKGFDDAEIAAALERCREFGYLDDERFALERARGLMRSGRAVGAKVLQDLRRRGVSEELARDALERAGQEFDETEQLRDIVNRRFPNLRFGEADEKTRRRVVNHFLRRGFPLARVLSFLHEER